MPSQFQFLYYIPKLVNLDSTPKLFEDINNIITKKIVY